MSEARNQVRRLFEIVTGASPGSADEKRVEKVRKALLAESLSKKERDWLANQSTAGGEVRWLEGLVERRLQGVLGDLGETVVVQLAPGAAQTFLESVASDPDVQATLQDVPESPVAPGQGFSEEPLDTLIDGEEPLDTLIDSEEPLDTLIDSEEPLDTLDDSDPGARAEEVVNSGGRVVVVTDASSVRTLEGSIPHAEFHTDDTLIEINKPVRHWKSSKERNTAQTSARVQVVEADDTLEEIQRVLLWSVTDKERKNIVRRAARDSLVGAVLGGKYKIHEKRGQGGFGAVYRATDKILDVDVAVKVLKPRFLRAPDAMARFLAEAKRLTEVDHPNVVRWITFDRTADGLHYFVMEYLGSGEEIGTLIQRDGKFEPDRAAALILQVLSALCRTHELPDGSSLLHLDLKPQNILVLPEISGDPERVKVIDFGISRHSRHDVIPAATVQQGAAAGDSEEDETKEGGPGKTVAQSSGRKSRAGHITRSTVPRVHGGTPLYASPEQCRHMAGDSQIVELDGRADIYSVGVVAFEMLTGGYPFPRPTSQSEAMRNHMQTPPRSLREVAPDVPRDLCAFVDKCLAKDREARWASAEEAFAALDAIVHPNARAVRWVGGAVLAAGIVIAALVWTMLGGDARQLVSCTVAFGDQDLELGDAVLRVPAGEPDGRWITPKVAPEVPVEDARLTDRDGSELAGFVVEWSDEVGAFHVTYPKAPRATPGPSARMHAVLAWSAGEDRRSPGFEVKPLSPPVWGQIAAPDPIRIVDRKGAPVEGWDSATSQLLVDEASLRLALSIQNDDLTPIDPVRLRLNDQRTIALVSRPRRKGESHFDVPLGDVLAGAPTLDEMAILQVEDMFGRIAEQDIRLRLTALRPELALDGIAWVSESGARQQVSAPEHGAIAGFYRAEGETAKLVLRVRLATPERETRIVATWQDHALPLEAIPDGDLIEVRISADPLTASGTLLLTADDRNEVSAARPDLLIDETKLRLNIYGIPEVEWSLTASDSWIPDQPPLEFTLGPAKVPSVRRGSYEMHIADTGLEGWFARVGYEGQSLGGGEIGAHGIKVPFEPSEPRSRLWLELHPPTAVRSGADKAFPDGEPLVRRECHVELDDALVLAQQAATPWTLKSETLRIAAQDEPLVHARCGMYRAGEVPARLDGRPLIDAQSDGSVEFVAADWDGPESVSSDGTYVLAVEGIDTAHNIESIELDVTINNSGPTVQLIRPVEGGDWLPDDAGDLKLSLRVADGNGVVPPTEVRFTTSAGTRIDLPDELIWNTAWLPGMSDREADFSTRLRLPPDASSVAGKLELVARDTEGSKTPCTWTLRIGDLPLPASAARLVDGDACPMRLVDPPRSGTYLFGEEDMGHYRERLRQHGVHWAERQDFEAIEQWLKLEAPPQMSIPCADFAPYYLDEHEVSRAQYALFLGDKERGYMSDVAWEGLPSSPTRAERSERHEILSKQCSHDTALPIDCVTWIEAWSFARWTGKRLPTYLEWEFAVRGTEQRLFAASEPRDASIGRVGESREATFKVYAAVGDKPSPVDDGFDVSPQGLRHLCGNVAEWTSTTWTEEADPGLAWAATPHDPSTGLDGKSFWVVGADCRDRYKGTVAGRAYLPEHDYKTARKERHDFNRRKKDRFVGFRCAVDAATVAMNPDDWKNRLEKE